MNTKEKILEAMLELASINGIHKTSLSMVANKVGIRKASLYYYFTSKDEMVKEMYSTFRNRKINVLPIDFSLDIEEIVITSFRNYLLLCNDDKMKKVFMIVESEKFIDEIAKNIYLDETHTMLKATNNLFSNMQEVKNIEIVNLEEFAQLYCLYAHELVLLTVLNDPIFNEERCISSIKGFIKKFLKIKR